MVTELARGWWLIVLRGVIAILLGLAAFLWPGLTWLALVLLFGVYAIADGLLAVITGIKRTKDEPRWWVFLLEGLVSMIVGVIAILQPGLTGLVLLFLVASWAIITGILEILAAIRLRHEITNEWWLALGGLASMGLGILLVLQPAAGGLALIWTLGAYEIIFGIFFVFLGLRLKSWNEPGTRGRMVRTSP
jgi:uncharacterized membrane protein HdeD (DUF308 family)